MGNLAPERASLTAARTKLRVLPAETAVREDVSMKSENSCNFPDAAIVSAPTEFLSHFRDVIKVN